MRKVVVLAFIFCLGIPVFIHASIINVPGDYPTIQAGIDAAIDGDTVLIADGTYSGNGNYDIDFKGKAIEVSSVNGPGSCVVDCQNQGRGFYFHNGEGENSVLSGITIQNGYVKDNYGGGGILCLNSSSPTITNCSISRNTADGNGNGGGMVCYDMSSPTLVDCIITSNSAAGPFGGGGLCVWDSRLTITNCIISDNTANWEGGGVFCYFSYPVITNCLISGNSASFGGGLLIAFSGKNASRDPERKSDNPIILNSTIVNNYSGLSGGGIFFYDSLYDVSIITDCILWSNSPDQIDGDELTHFITYCNIEGGYAGVGNRDADPLFCVGPVGEYYLSQTASGQPDDSPCLDAGSDQSDNICFTMPTREICMDELTTRTDSIPDSGTVNMGFHYSLVPFTPNPTVTPSPTSTPNECTNLGCEVEVPAESFSTGDEFYCDIQICNPTDNTFENVPLYSILDVYGEIFLLPPLIVDVPPGISAHTLIPMFIWPENSGEGQATIYAAMTNETVSELFGVFGYFAFSWTD